MIATRTGLDAGLLKKAYGTFPSGVVALASRVDTELVGMAASSFTAVSMEPPLVSVCIQNSSSTWPRLLVADRVGVSVLSSEHGNICRKLSERGVDRFEGIAVREDGGGAVFIRGAVAELSCAVDETIVAGDHKIVLLRVHQVAIAPESDPLIFYSSGFHKISGARRQPPGGVAGAC